MSDPGPILRLDVYNSAAFRAVAGAYVGDPVDLGGVMNPGDLYRLAATAQPYRLGVLGAGSTQACLAPTSQVGQPGAPLAIEACLTFMGEHGDVVDLLVLRVDAVAYLLPLGALAPGQDYELLGSQPDQAPRRFSDLATVSFIAGTRLARADGVQIPVEALSVGDQLLTRDHGPQEVRAIAVQTRRATGPNAAVHIARGTLNAYRDLRLLPQHRLFIWQRRDTLGLGQAEVMVRAELLVNGGSVTREKGGYIDTYSLHFDGHRILYAEGIAVESLLVSEHAPADDSPQVTALDLPEDRAGPLIAEQLAQASRGARNGGPRNGRD